MPTLLCDFCSAPNPIMEYPCRSFGLTGEQALKPGASVTSQPLIVALLYLARRYPYLPNHRLRACYLWYLSTAPSSALAPFVSSGDDLPKLIGTAGVDVGVCGAYHAGWHGRLGLHADPRGGAELIEFYQRCAMTRLPQTSRLPRGLRRLTGNDGRYLYLNEAGAISFRKRLTPFHD
jgi:hypothetical protein